MAAKPKAPEQPKKHPGLPHRLGPRRADNTYSIESFRGGQWLGAIAGLEKKEVEEMLAEMKKRGVPVEEPAKSK